MCFIFSSYHRNRQIVLASGADIVEVAPAYDSGELFVLYVITVRLNNTLSRDYRHCRR